MDLTLPQQKKVRIGGKGAKVASGIVFIVDYFQDTDDPDPATFASRWQMADGRWQMATMVMESNYETVTTSIYDNIELSVIIG